jgi:hypothetical protein
VQHDLLVAILLKYLKHGAANQSQFESYLPHLVSFFHWSLIEGASPGVEALMEHSYNALFEV